MENSFREGSKSLFNLQVDETSKSHLLEAARWVKFLTIISLIFMGLVLLIMIFAGAAMSSAYSGSAGMGALGATGMIILFIFMFALYFYPIYAMLKFANMTKAGLLTSNQEQFNGGLGYLKGAFKYMGILMIIVLGLYAVMFLFTGLGALL